MKQEVKGRDSTASETVLCVGVTEPQKFAKVKRNETEKKKKKKNSPRLLAHPALPTPVILDVGQQQLDEEVGLLRVGHPQDGAAVAGG